MPDTIDLTEAIVKTIVAAHADPEDVVRVLGYALVWHLGRMPPGEAKLALRHVFDQLAANGYMAFTSEDVGHG